MKWPKLREAFEVTQTTWTHYSGRFPANSGYCEEWYDVQFLMKRYYLGGCLLWEKCLCEERLPVWVSCAAGTCGHVDYKFKCWEMKKELERE